MLFFFDRVQLSLNHSLYIVRQYIGYTQHGMN